MTEIVKICRYQETKKEKYRPIALTLHYIDKLSDLKIITIINDNFHKSWFKLSRRHARRFYSPIAANIVSENRTKWFSPTIDADTLGVFFFSPIWHFELVPWLHLIAAIFHFEKKYDKIAYPDWLAIRSNEDRKWQERAHLANAGEFNRRYLTCHSAINENRNKADRCWAVKRAVRSSCDVWCTVALFSRFRFV